MLQRDIRICPSYVRECQVSSCEAWVCVYHCRLRLRRRWHINATAVRMRQRTTKDLWKWITYPRYLWRSAHKWFQVVVSSIAGLVHRRISFDKKNFIYRSVNFVIFNNWTRSPQGLRANSQWGEAEWAIDPLPLRAKGLIFLVSPN